MMTWAELMDQAMLGTGSAPAAAEAWEGHSSEQALLKQFVLAGTARRAGLIAQVARSMPTVDPAPPEKLAPCSSLALDWLKQVQRTIYTRELVRDWCILMIKRRKRVPHTALPYVLNLATTQPEWIPYLLPLVGERGRWLIDRTESYAALRQQELWSGKTSELKPADIAEDNKTLIELRSQMKEGLAHE